MPSLPAIFLFLVWVGIGIGKVAAQPGVALEPENSRAAVRQSAPPSPPAPKSPVAYLRELLAMKSAERETALAGKARDAKSFVLEKLSEYDALPPVERELRLRLMDLRWHLVPLMRTSPAARAARLSLVPPEDRPLIEERLRQWDQVAPELQKEFLEHETTIHYFLRLESSGPAQRETLFQTFPAGARNQLEIELAAWRALPLEKRERMCDRFHQFFELNEKEKEKTLSALPDTERQQMGKALQAFQGLPGSERKQWIDAFRKFAGMTPEERSQFLHNAERWQKMSATERQLWRQLVQNVAPTPPLPPGFGAGAPPRPVLLATNVVR